MEILDPYIYPEDGNDFSVSDQILTGGIKTGDDNSMSSSKAVLVKRFIGEIKDKLDIMEKLLTTTSELDAQDVEKLLLRAATRDDEAGQIIEGVFDGEHMMGADGKLYTIPSNYASKSKLVEGDILKLTVRDDGTFLYKQIGPIERQRIIGKLAEDGATGDFVVIADGKKWSVLLASVTYFHAEPGDDIVILVPKNAPSRWAAVENVIRNTETVSKKDI